ncbi:2-phosphosulfolactate phosphatase [Pseudonocardia sp. HH130630-07]|uniref:2-phosphosulfolactate phosphatase n=1 Tax=Pseudonocardia sp. HH130630-07 TaxID=1690815 RepID=UPI000814D0C7|nr:2-phosphosulfolactate phosphatase [Pseudonocardia sp. HH130630-07]ANY09172.1 hypothetical protein AFB00_26305 [Pseudonocardia sp. HH130630-07]
MTDTRPWAEPVRIGWGPAGAAAMTGADLLVVADVLSFTTTLTVALDRGVPVVPCARRDDHARELARRHDATLAAPRGAGPVSLSPVSVRSAPGLRRLVLPSPNGATIAAGASAPVLGVSLRNRAGAVRLLRERCDRGARIGVVAAGERWPDGALRPAVEDLVGAGAVLAGLPSRLLSPEALAVAAAAGALLGDPAAALHDCVSGRELVGRGWEEDVDVAAELDSSPVLPVLTGGVFVDAAA